MESQSTFNSNSEDHKDITVEEKQLIEEEIKAYNTLYKYFNKYMLSYTKDTKDTKDNINGNYVKKV
jgi:hypothetical protein